MPYITVVLQDGSKVHVPDAETADWIQEKEHVGDETLKTRLVCKKGDVVLGRFDADHIAGYTWHDGRAP